LPARIGRPEHINGGRCRQEAYAIDSVPLSPSTSFQGNRDISIAVIHGCSSRIMPGTAGQAVSGMIVL
jgi:hypothetical protein